MRYGIALASLLVILAAPARAPDAQTGIRVTSAPAPAYTFGGSVTFQISAESTAPITDVTLYVRTPEQTRTFVGKARFARGNAITAAYTLERSRRALAAFSPVEYWWELKDSAGNSLITNRFSFNYADNRYEWQSLAEDRLVVSWYEGDLAFGQSAMDVAVEGLNRANRDLRAPLPEQINIYIYPNRAAAQEAFNLTTPEWADGQAHPVLGVVIILTTPTDVDAVTRMGSEIPHELTHILVYQATGANYPLVPTWLNEGLAKMYEASPDPDTPAALNQARDAGKLLSLETLCAPFPADAAEAQTAYAQSESLVRYIHGRYGAAGLKRLLAAYADGGECAAGVKQALNVSLVELEAQWLEQAVHANPATLQLRLWAPWLIIGALVLLAPLVFFVATLRVGRARAEPETPAL